MIYLCLAVLSSTLISIIMRISSDKAPNRLSMLASNYIVCCLLGAFYAGNQLWSFSSPRYPAAAALGAINGLLYLASFILFQYSTDKNGIVLSSVFIKLGLLVPMAVSVLFFKEIPSGAQTIGFAAAVFAIVLINWQKDASFSGSAAILLLLLIMIKVSRNIVVSTQNLRFCSKFSLKICP